MRTKTAFSEVSITHEREQIEVTKSGIFDGKPDHMRKFVPGPTYVTVTINGESYTLTPEEYERSLEHWLIGLRAMGK